MKKYIAPEMTTLPFMAEEPIAGLLEGGTDSTLFNNGEFGQW